MTPRPRRRQGWAGRVTGRGGAGVMRAGPMLASSGAATKVSTTVPVESPLPESEEVDRRLAENLAKQLSGFAMAKDVDAILAYGRAQKRAGLERAAKTVCSWCEPEVVLVGSFGPAVLRDGRWRHQLTWPDGGKSWTDCKASAIRALMVEPSEKERTARAASEASAEELRRERDEARRFGEDVANRYNALLAEGRVLRCAFCSEEYPPGTPPTQHEALTAHVMVCAKHPMRAAEASAQRLAEALGKIADRPRGKRPTIDATESRRIARAALDGAPERKR